jgi:hypothetical protein
VKIREGFRAAGGDRADSCSAFPDCQWRIIYDSGKLPPLTLA